MDSTEDLKRQLMLTFQAELQEHLSTLNGGLLALESGPEQEARAPLLTELFRAAHSLKGAARAVDLQEIEKIAHRMEDVLGAFRRGDLSPSPAHLDPLFSACDALQEAMASHLKGEALPTDRRRRLMARLEAILSGDEEAAPEEEAPAVSPRAAELPPGALRPPEETIRVTTDKVDALMNGVGELLVARMRTEQHLTELRALQRRLARWEKRWRQSRVYLGRLQQRARDNGDKAVQLTSADDLQLDDLVDLLADNQERLKATSGEVKALARRFSADYRHLTIVTEGLRDSVRRVRMLPIVTLFDPFPRMVRDLAREQGKKVTLEVEGAQTEVDRQVLELMKDPLIHLLRNAIDHGIEKPDRREAAGKSRRGTIHLRAAQRGNTIVLEVADDGAGIDLAAVGQAAVDRDLLTSEQMADLSKRETVELIFLPNLSTLSQVTDVSGRGIGLNVVRENLARLHGRIQVDTEPGRGTTFTLTLPLTLATSRVLLVRAADLLIALPTSSIERILEVDEAARGSIEGKPALRVDGHPLPLVSLSRVLARPQIAPAESPGQRVPVVVLGAVEKRVAFQVDALLQPQEVVIKSMGPQLRRVRNVAGVTILGSGDLAMVLNVADLVRSALDETIPEVSLPMERAAPPRRRRVLVVDDSITTRTLEKNILEGAGYRVTAAVDGQDAWALIQSETPDVVVADVAMPRMDGFVLTEKIRADERYRDLPVILVTSLESQEDRIRGLEAGADAYITKGTFDQQELLETIERQI